ncbi:MAG: ABC transporter substrate-binding protein [Clostridiales bacterium]|jgi:NitT/TauT family transport system substrate-binding protein|nr:ABC transporter substrate-binding protein [Clostridiales bacterium]
MRFLFKVGSILLVFAFLCCAVTGCSEKKGADKIRLSEVTHSVFYAPQYVAINNGYFAEEGIEIELTNGQGADKVMTAVISGAADIGFAGPEAAIYVYNEGKEDYAEVFALLTQRDGSFLMGRTPPGGFEWSDLEGSLILPGRKGGVPYMTLEYVLKSKGLVPGVNVTFDDSIQFALMAASFSSGHADYVTIFEPTASMLEAEGKGYILASIGQESGEIPYTAYFANRSFIKKNSDLIQRFVNAIYKAQRWVEQSSAEDIAAVVAPSFPDTDIAILISSIQRYKDIGAYALTPFLKEEAFDKLQTVMSEAGELKQKAPFDKVVNNSFALAAVE